MTTTVDPSTLVGGRYVLEKLIGEGGTGEVWRARHVTLRSPVAIKLLHGSAAFRESSRRRFLTEARVAAQLNTRHAVKVFDFGVTEQGRPYLIMELLDGETLADRLERVGALTPYATARILRLASRALDAAHTLGVVHRDFKPENIFLVRTEEEEEDVKVVDFGIAKLMGELEEDVGDSAPRSSRRFDKALVSFTRTGKSVGTPYYMAPEQTKAETNVGHAADIWAIGVVAYECLTGSRPFVAGSIQELFERISTCTYVPAKERNPSLPEDFDAWFRTACSPDPSERFANASSATLALIEVLGIQSALTTLGDAETMHSLLPSVRSSSSWPVRSSSSVPAGRSVFPSAPGSEQSRPRARRFWGKLALGGAGVFIAAFGVVSWWHLRTVPAPVESPLEQGKPSATAPSSHQENLVPPPVPTHSVAPMLPHSAVPTEASAAPEPARGRPEENEAKPPPRLDGYRDLPGAWPAKPVRPSESVPARAEDSAETVPAPAPEPPEPSAPDPTGSASPFKLPELGF